MSGRDAIHMFAMSFNGSSQKPTVQFAAAECIGRIDRPPEEHDITKIRTSRFREAVMKNVTISMDEQLARRIRVAAAKAGESISRYLAEAGRRRLEDDEAGAADRRRNRQLEALERILAGPKWDVTENGRMPTADERNARRSSSIRIRSLSPRPRE